MFEVGNPVTCGRSVFAEPRQGEPSMSPSRCLMKWSGSCGAGRRSRLARGLGVRVLTSLSNVVTGECLAKRHASTNTLRAMADRPRPEPQLPSISVRSFRNDLSEQVHCADLGVSCSMHSAPDDGCPWGGRGGRQRDRYGTNTEALNLSESCFARLSMAVSPRRRCWSWVASGFAVVNLSVAA